MCDIRTHPIHRDQVYGIKFLKIKCFVVVVGREIGLGPVLKVANVADGHVITLDRCIGKDRHVRLPRSIVGGRDRHPPEHNESKTGDKPQNEFSAVFAQDQRAHPSQDQ